MTVPYPPENCKITFMEPFYRVEQCDKIKKYYIKAVVNDTPVKEIRIVREQQKRIMDWLLEEDSKLLNAQVVCENDKFYVTRHSPQGDFFELVK